MPIPRSHADKSIRRAKWWSGEDLNLIRKSWLHAIVKLAFIFDAYTSLLKIRSILTADFRDKQSVLTARCDATKFFQGLVSTPWPRISPFSSRELRQKSVSYKQTSLANKISFGYFPAQTQTSKAGLWSERPCCLRARHWPRILCKTTVATMLY